MIAETIDHFQIKYYKSLRGDWWKKTNESLYKIKKPLSKIGLGFDNLPKQIKESKILKGSDLAILASSKKFIRRKELINTEIRFKRKTYISKRIFKSK